MKRKGVTPVVAIILLIAFTVLATGVVYNEFDYLVDKPPQPTDSDTHQEVDYPYYTATYNGSNGTHVLTRHCTHFSPENKTCWHTLHPVSDSTDELEYRGEFP